MSNPNPEKSNLKNNSTENNKISSEISSETSCKKHLLSLLRVNKSKLEQNPDSETFKKIQNYLTEIYSKLSRESTNLNDLLDSMISKLEFEMVEITVDELKKDFEEIKNEKTFLEKFEIIMKINIAFINMLGDKTWSLRSDDLPENSDELLLDFSLRKKFLGISDPQETGITKLEKEPESSFEKTMREMMKNYQANKNSNPDSISD